MGGRSDGGEVARVLLWLLIALILAFAVLGVVMSLTMGWVHPGIMGAGFGWMGFIVAIPAIILVLILLAVLGAFDRTYTSKSAALEALELRLARGEISVEEFNRLREELLR